jgi:hypothetical protein
MTIGLISRPEQPHQLIAHCTTEKIADRISGEPMLLTNSCPFSVVSSLGSDNEGSIRASH